MNKEDWVLDTLDRLEQENFWGVWSIQLKNGRIVVMRFEKTELPPKELIDD